MALSRGLRHHHCFKNVFQEQLVGWTYHEYHDNEFNDGTIYGTVFIFIFVSYFPGIVSMDLSGED